MDLSHVLVTLCMNNIFKPQNLYYIFVPEYTRRDKKSWNLSNINNNAKEKYRGVFEIQRSGDKTSSAEIGLDIKTHASPKVGQDQVFFNNQNKNSTSIFRHCRLLDINKYLSSSN